MECGGNTAGTASYRSMMNAQFGPKSEPGPNQLPLKTDISHVILYFLSPVSSKLYSRRFGFSVQLILLLQIVS
jgi:hypothetical protein